MNSRLGSYALGVALTGLTSNEIAQHIKEEQEEIDWLIDQLRAKTGVHPIKLRDRIDRVFNPRLFTKVDFIRHVLNGSPMYIKGRLNLKDWEYNPKKTDDTKADSVG